MEAGHGSTWQLVETAPYGIFGASDGNGISFFLSPVRVSEDKFASYNENCYRQNCTNCFFKRNQVTCSRAWRNRRRLTIRLFTTFAQHLGKRASCIVSIVRTYQCLTPNRIAPLCRNCKMPRNVWNDWDWSGLLVSVCILPWIGHLFPWLGKTWEASRFGNYIWIYGFLDVRTGILDYLRLPPGKFVLARQAIWTYGIQFIYGVNIHFKYTDGTGVSYYLRGLVVWPSLHISKWRYRLNLSLIRYKECTRDLGHEKLTGNAIIQIYTNYIKLYVYTVYILFEISKGARFWYSCVVTWKWWKMLEIEIRLRQIWMHFIATIVTAGCAVVGSCPKTPSFANLRSFCEGPVLKQDETCLFSYVFI